MQPAMELVSSASMLSRSSLKQSILEVDEGVCNTPGNTTPSVGSGLVSTESDDDSIREHDGQWSLCLSSSRSVPSSTLSVLLVGDKHTMVAPPASPPSSSLRTGTITNRRAEAQRHMFRFLSEHRAQKTKETDKAAITTGAARSTHPQV